VIAALLERAGRFLADHAAATFMVVCLTAYLAGCMTGRLL
jgi:hypothetical protein